MAQEEVIYDLLLEASSIGEREESTCNVTGSPEHYAVLLSLVLVLVSLNL